VAKTSANTCLVGVAILLAAVAILAWPAQAQAHTELVGWRLEQAATSGQQQLRLTFSEPIDGRFLTVSVIDLDGKTVQSGGVTIDQTRRTEGLVGLWNVSAGVYSVAWWTRALDGDPSNGSFILGLGTKVEPASVLPPVGARDPATQPAAFWDETVWNTLLHWFTYLGCVLLLGSLAFVMIAWQPAAERARSKLQAANDDAGGMAREKLERTDYDVSRLCRILALSGATLFVMANLLMLVLQVGFVRYSLLQPVTSVAPTPLAPSSLSHQAPYKALAEILSGYNGHIWLARMGLGVGAVAAALLPAPRVRYQHWRWLLAFIVGLGAVFTVSLTAHAAVIPQAGWARFLDWSHLVVMSIWIGGLLSLLFTVRTMRQSGTGDLLPSLAPTVAGRFSTLALGAFIYMAVTGAVEGYLHVRHPGLLTPTTYGLALIAKLCLFALLFAFGALHRRLTLPRLSAQRSTSRTAIERLLPIEFTVGASLLVAVALMASLATSEAAWPAHLRLGFHSSTAVSSVLVTLRAVPGRAGENAVALDITDRRPGAPTVGRGATLTVGGQNIPLQPTGTQAVGITQRFSSSDLMTLPQMKGDVTFTFERPSYPGVSGVIRLELPAALPGKG
jgi:putative copper export protein/methionine-rich copper-binding protein CopC